MLPYGKPIESSISPIICLVLAPDGSRLFGWDKIDSLAAIDTQKQEQITVVNVGGGEGNMALSPDGSLLYVASGNDKAVTMFETKELTKTGSIPVGGPAGGTPRNVAPSPDGSLLFVLIENPDEVVGIKPAQGNMPPVQLLQERPNTVMVLQTSNNQPYTSDIPVGQCDLMTRSPDGSLLYLTNSGGHNLTVIDIHNPQKAALIALGGDADEGVLGLAWSPDGSLAYMLKAESMDVIDSNTHQPVGRATIPARLPKIEDPVVSPDGGWLYVPIFGMDEIIGGDRFAK